MVRKFNFNPGPATLPLSVLEKAQKEFVDYKGVGMSLLEISHRSKEFESLLKQTKDNLKEIMEIPDTHEIIFLGGGASLQFAMVPMNFLGDQGADYVCTGEWAQRAIKEAKLFGKVNVAASSEEAKFTYIPDKFTFSPNASYVHITTNNTIYGGQWKKMPDTGNVPLIADMSSDFMSRKVDVKKFAMIYAGAQKNAGPAGATIVIIKKDFMDKVVKSRQIPTMLQYKTHVENDSLYNTPPVYPIYIIGLVTEWTKEIGGLKKIEEVNKQKAELLYQTIDSMPDFYKGTVRKDSRSYMNAPFRLPSEELEKKFVSEAEKQNFIGLKGHRSVGGIRVSMYNALPLEAIEKLTQFMKDFAAKNKAK